MTTHHHDPLSRMTHRFRRENGDGEAVSRNERAVLSQIWSAGGLQRSALQTRMDLTQQSIHRIISHLQERGLVVVGDLEPPAYKGKPSPRLSLDPGFASAAGISINTDSAGLCLMDFAGSYETRTLPIDGITMTGALDQIEAAMVEMLTERGCSHDALFGIGFAIAGYVVEGTRYSAPEPLAEWSQYQLAPLLSERFGLPVWTENGANTGAICEQMLGVGREIDNFVYLSFNYGFGGGIVLNGELVRGGFGNAGELSGMFPDVESLDRPALRGLLEMLQARGVKVFTINDLAGSFDMSWPGVAEWLDRVQPQYDRVFNVLNATVDPEVVVLGGQIPRPLGEALIARTSSYNRLRQGTRRRTPEQCVSEIGGETAAIGAAALALKKGFF